MAGFYVDSGVDQTICEPPKIDWEAIDRARPSLRAAKMMGLTNRYVADILGVDEGWIKQCLNGVRGLTAIEGLSLATHLREKIAEWESLLPMVPMEGDAKEKIEIVIEAALALLTVERLTMGFRVTDQEGRRLCYYSQQENTLGDLTDWTEFYGLDD